MEDKEGGFKSFNSSTGGGLKTGASGDGTYVAGNNIAMPLLVPGGTPKLEVGAGKG